MISKYISDLFVNYVKYAMRNSEAVEGVLTNRYVSEFAIPISAPPPKLEDRTESLMLFTFIPCVFDYALLFIVV